MALVFKTLILVLVTISTNGFLMSNTTSAPCRDDQPNCQILDDNFAVCKDPQKARELCRRYCNFCDTVDGDWSVWGTWGGCDVTCGNGTRRRTRSCNNPAPAQGGMYCEGSSTETSDCGINKCPGSIE
ncbi:ectin-like [Mya arenaria]|uniref:ectin-like n=1 Tax=Mya arenaria TaxID=6604 RepID=UPI0022E5A5FB|nr:ectin-like [Mya arenaria]